MAMVGHLTMSIYSPYAFADEFMPKDAAEKLNRLDEFNQAQITGKAERVKKNQQRGQSLQLVEFQEGGMWPGTESNCRHEDFQSSALPTELPGQKLGIFLKSWRESRLAATISDSFLLAPR